MHVTIMPVGFLGTNCYILESADKSCAVIDPGAQPEKIRELLAKRGLTPRYLLLTHGHHDHIGGLKQLAAAYPDAEALIGEGDLEMLENASLSGASRYGSANDLQFAGAGTVRDGQELPLDELTIRVVETPGHTKGGVCYQCEDVLFAGDTLFRNDVGRCDLYGGDYDVMKASLRKLVALAGDYTVYPGHGESTKLEYERRNNPYIAEAMA